MTAFNVVRFRVKPGREAEFLEAQKKAHMDFAGFRHFAIIKTGDRTYCVIGECESGTSDPPRADPENGKCTPRQVRSRASRTGGKLKTSG